MTTIAFKDGVVAADTQVTYDGTRDSTTTKIVRNALGDIGGAAGNAAYMHAFLKWFSGGEKGDCPTPTEQDGGVIVRGDGSIECFEHPGPCPFTVKAAVYAIGSGRKLALGAMAFGASAEEAVKIAAEYDVCTGGDITVLIQQGTPA